MGGEAKRNFAHKMSVSLFPYILVGIKPLFCPELLKENLMPHLNEHLEITL